MPPEHAALTAAAIKVRHAIACGHGDDRLHKRAKLVALQNHWPELFEALGELLVALHDPTTNPPLDPDQPGPYYPAGDRHAN